tara:strand:+ start:38 stop:1708 length:1671 start_codon:yes stop_codon:yes gene_type:complete
MKKLLLLLILSFFSVQGFAAGCPDGSEPVKSISDDGTYFVFSCGGQSSSSNSNSNSKSGTVSPEALYESTKSGDWFTTDWIKPNGNPFPMWTPHYAKFQLVFTEISKSYSAGNFSIGDFDNDGIDDYFQLTPPKLPGVDWDSAGPDCRTELGDCYSDTGSVSVYKVERRGTKWGAEDVSGLIDWGDDNTLFGVGPTDLHIADFNGDGKLDIFVTDTHNVDSKFWGKNDPYLLSNAEGFGWTESTKTHISGHKIRNSRGLINFSHGSSVGDIDADGDTDIIVTSINWVGAHAEDPRKNGEILCYVNQGDGHMVVRQCGNQWGNTAALGDMDNDGDLDLVWGTKTLDWVKDWDQWSNVPGCHNKIGNSWIKKSTCNGIFSGILYNDGKGNFNQRGFEFPDLKNSNGFTYQSTPAMAVADLDDDGDLDVIRSHVGHLYAGAGMSIEENLGDGTFNTVFDIEFCKGPKNKGSWPTQEGSKYNCWVSDFKFADFNNDGLIDIYLDGHDANNSDNKIVKDGAVFMSNGKFTYDILKPSRTQYPGGFKDHDKGYPLVEMKIRK